MGGVEVVHHLLLDRDYEPGGVHRFLAGLPALLRERGAPPPLLVTTNYDRALERALDEAGEAPDVVSYVSLGRDRGKFLHRSADGPSRVIDTPNAYADVPVDGRVEAAPPARFPAPALGCVPARLPPPACPPPRRLLAFPPPSWLPASSASPISRSASRATRRPIRRRTRRSPTSRTSSASSTPAPTAPSRNSFSTTSAISISSTARRRRA